MSRLLLRKLSPLIISQHTAPLPFTSLHFMTRSAKIVRAKHGQVDVDDILDTHAFSFESAEESPGWLAELNSFESSHLHERSASHGSSSSSEDKYGLSSFVYYAKRPFHPNRLMDRALSTNWEGVLRTKGFFWLASRHDVMGIWQSAGGSWQGEPGGLWVAAQASSKFEFEGEKSWDPMWGDRCQQIVWIGIGMDRGLIERMLNECLLADEEMELGLEAWAAFDDPLPPWEYEDHDHHHDRDHVDETEDEESDK